MTSAHFSSIPALPSSPSGKSGWPWDAGLQHVLEGVPEGEPWPKISVVLPNYNYGRYVEESIRSILLQGYPNLECIVIDGGSTDNSLEIIRKYEPWISYWESEKDRGQV